MTWLRLYFLVTWLAWPLLYFLLLRRRWRGKELPFRMRERRGIATKQRTGGRLIWFHGASIGETLSILPLANLILEAHPRAEALITSGTLASANLIADRLPARAQHQFLPLDHPRWVRRFLRTWRPSVGIWAESEVWPNLVRQCHGQGIPLHLVNARLSVTSFQRWRARPSAAYRLFSSFSSIIAQSQEDAERFAKLGAHAPVNGGNIKFAGQPLPAAETQVDSWRAAFADRPTWFAANTHQGEETQVLKVHEALKLRYPSLVTIIAPRHIERVPEVQAEVLHSHTHALYSEGAEMIAGHSILLVDRLGVLGPLYRTSRIALVAGSLIPDIGGHNPIEPARNGAAVLVGSHMDNQLDLVDLFVKADALIQISDSASLLDAVDFLLSDQERRRELQARASDLVRSQADVLRLYSNALLPKVAEAIQTAEAVLRLPLASTSGDGIVKNARARGGQPFWWQRRDLIAGALLPLGVAYAVLDLLNRLVCRARTVPVPVVCVGNLTVGGAGKTPITQALARLLIARGIKPAIVSRGYGRRSHVALRVDPGAHTWQDVGDEPLLHARLCPTYVAADRWTAARQAAQAGAQVVLMDDGLQHYGLVKDLAIEVRQARDGLGNGFPLPAGPLRQWFGLGQGLVDLRLIVGEDAEIEAALPPDWPANDRPIGAFCGIASPTRFQAILADLGLELDWFQAFRDHHAFTTADLRKLSANAQTHRVLTTEKDWVRLPSDLQDQVYAVRYVVKLVDAEGIWKSLKETLDHINGRAA